MKKSAFLIVLGVMCIIGYLGGARSFAFDPGTCQKWDNGKPKECKRVDDSGRLTDRSYYREDGSLISWTSYDSDGNMIEESYYDERGGFDRNPIGENHWSAVRCIYLDGKLAKKRYYNRQGELIQVDTFDDLGDLSDHKLASDSLLTDKDDFVPVPERDE